jgi:peroxiredoxin Q/BCP
MRRLSDTLKPGSQAPPFELATQRGDLVTLAHYLARGPVLLAFHRGTWCPNCQRQFGELARRAPDYQKRGVQVVCVVAQKSEAVRRYVEDKGLPFFILIDTDREVTKAYGVWHRLGLDAWNIARPSLFVVDRRGTIQSIYVGESQDEFPSPEEIDKEIARLVVP